MPTIEKKPPNKLLSTGIVGVIVTGLCCFTPVLVTLLGAVGMGAVTGYLDLILLPLLVFFIGMTLFAFAKRKNEGRGRDTPPVEGN
ncbi:MAG: mercury resistance system transport protein MerF [Nitrospiria bacterium]